MHDGWRITDSVSLPYYWYLLVLSYYHIFIYIFRYFQYRIPLSEEVAKRTRDGLAKVLYGQMFNQIVAQMNNDTCDYTTYIGILDIAGYGK